MLKVLIAFEVVAVLYISFLKFMISLMPIDDGLAFSLTDEGWANMAIDGVIIFSAFTLVVSTFIFLINKFAAKASTKFSVGFSTGVFVFMFAISVISAICFYIDKPYM